MVEKYPPPKPSRDATPESGLLGVDLGGNHIRIGNVEQSGNLIALRREPYSEQAIQSSSALVEQILAVVRQMVDEHTPTSPIAAIGVAFPGPVNQKTQRVLSLPHLPSLAEIDLHEEFSRAFGVPVHFDNNANAAAFAEMSLGTARGIDDWLYLHIGANVSAGLVLGGKLQRGKSGLSGAIGQMRIDPERIGDSIQLETMVSAGNIVRRTRDRLQRDKTSSLSRLGAMGGFTYDDIITAAHGGDDLAKMMLQRTGIFITMAIADVISLLNLAMIAVGGAPAGRQFLVQAIAAEAQQRASEEALKDCQFVAAELGAEAGVIGAALLANLRYRER
ncbi:MAG: ROK family protein [Acidobacteria bacterium]|nr:ROK family protein [Acidobacteriota bacterium]